MHQIKKAIDMVEARILVPVVSLTFDLFNVNVPLASLLRRFNVRLVRTGFFVRQPAGWWPLPESFSTTDVWQQASLPPRSAHPVVRYHAVDTNPHIPEKFPFDKYELEKSPLSDFLLHHHRTGGCWQCFVVGSSNGGGSNSDGKAEPFGYIKPSVTSNAVHLYVLPFAYPRLWALLEELKKNGGQITTQWRMQFFHYLDSIPKYYALPMKNAMKRYGVDIVPE
eukprot:CAMPEP_0198351920 /NCGR_PEP_ID=MMETSP1450-20131203/104791_1 /TAXON_ID=753684 ORGANISM="Madagascaria erythrocladiodes, Strain CCMP3234" /NCGR_SAMPLE_ID=MMETSP1450 /ASSEMBLY_ACC=CAM_ASM_001115 /LENGTH=222 /DNA_ID=CAMNT_0044057897 /DNA_START=36 /DNA_END=701 /DNA_ORIENTATION=+